MSLNIKNEAAHKLARELSGLTGESMAEAVTRALRERLHRVRSERRGDLAERLLAIGRDCASRLKDPVKSMDHDSLLYGEDGLPK